MDKAFAQRNKTEMITVTALLAALFAMTALAFKGFVIVHSITELRPVNAFPIIYGLLFGSVGAWGSCLGNILGDAVGGTLTFASVGGAIGNFAMAYIPYKVWGALMCKEGERMFLLGTPKSYLQYFLLAVLSATSAATIIPVFTDIFGFVSYNILFSIIFLNNFVVECTLGVLLYNIVSRLCSKGWLKELRTRVFSLKTVTGQKKTAFLLTIVTLLALIVSLFFVIFFPKGLGQVEILVTMSILNVMMLILMKEF